MFTALYIYQVCNCNFARKSYVFVLECVEKVLNWCFSGKITRLHIVTFDFELLSIIFSFFEYC